MENSVRDQEETQEYNLIIQNQETIKAKIKGEK